MALLDRVPAPRIRLLTFTRAATAEVAGKVAEHPQAAVERPSTIHSFSIAMLLRNRGASQLIEPLRIADSWEEKNLVHADLAHFTGVEKRTVTRRLLPELAAAGSRSNRTRTRKSRKSCGTGSSVFGRGTVVSLVTRCCRNCPTCSCGRSKPTMTLMASATTSWSSTSTRT